MVVNVRAVVYSAEAGAAVYDFLAWRVVIPKQLGSRRATVC